jgi:effector-binding domain-containing protein
MKKKIFILLALAIVIAACIIPVTQQKTITIKSPFLNLFVQLSDPTNWRKWRSDMNNIPDADTSKILIKKNPNSFSLNYEQKRLNVRSEGYLFAIEDNWSNKTTNYNYIIVPDKLLNKTSVVVSQTTSAINYLIRKISKNSIDETHVNDLKKFMETDSLLYGYNIFKTKVPDENLIEVKRKVPTKDQFIAAADIQVILQDFLKKHNVKKIQPLIAQFLPRDKDSIQVNVGFYVDKKVKSENEVIFTQMPKGGPLYAAKYTGTFDGRKKVYAGLRRYCADHSIQPAILPFESYLDDKLPRSDTDKINIQLNFSSYF